MRRRTSEDAKFFLLIFAPLMIVGAGLVWLASSMLDGIASSVNTQEHARAWQAVQSAFAAEERRLRSIMVDNAHWGEAVTNTYAPVNEEWIKGMWGDTTADDNYEVAMIVQPDGKTLSAYIHGEKVDVSAADYIGKERLERLIAEMPNDDFTFAYATTLINTPDSPMVLAAGTIVPIAGDAITVPARRANLLLFGQHINSRQLGEMGKQFIVDKLSYASLGDASAGYGVLTDKWNEPVWRVTWRDRNLGEIASREYRTSAILLLLGLLGLLVPISTMHYRAARQLSHSRAEAHRAARHDGLTGLPNRTFLVERLGDTLAGPQADSTALMYIDLDGFKNVNDAYGHEIGDLLLRMVAAGLRQLAGPHSIMRLGGDEFALLISGADFSSTAEELSRAIVDFVRSPFDVKGRSAMIGASIGIARGEKFLPPVELMRRADIAMYDAKDSGRGSWRWFNTALDDRRLDATGIAIEMRELLEKGLFDIAFQPIVDAETRNITGLEALARWPKSSTRKLSPAEFIPVAEEHGIINDLGRYITRKACRDLASWHGINLSINVSPIQLNDNSFAASLLQILREEGFDSARLDVEFTESVLIRNPQRAKAVIAELHRHHIKVSLDDFGSGYASVGYLRSFAFDRIKIDRTLTQAVLTDMAAQKVVQGTVLIARGLSADIIAEGIESEEEAQIMRLSGCHSLQGYHLGRPQPLQDLQPQLRALSEPVVGEAFAEAIAV